MNVSRTYQHVSLQITDKNTVLRMLGLPLQFELKGQPDELVTDKYIPMLAGQWW